MVLRAKGGEIRRHQQRIKQSIKGGGGLEPLQVYSLVGRYAQNMDVCSG